MYLEEIASCCGALLQRPPGLLDLAVLHLDGAVLLGQQRRLLLQLRVGPAQLGLLALQLVRALLQLGGEPLGLARAAPRCGSWRMIVLIATPIVPTNWSKNARCTSLNRVSEASSMHAEHLVLEQDRQHDHAHRRGLRRAPSRP